jgi:lipopolysaccharide transport system ATP-binding protein
MATPIIQVEHLTKEFRLGQLTSLGQSLRNTADRLLGRPASERAPFKALDDVSFSVEPGEVVGIVGHNGAGKSTLLKMLAGISQATRGSVRVHGWVAPLIEVGAGLVPDMTGRENVFLNAAILGMRRAEIKRKFDEIVAFAEMDEFIDTPIKRYSSGMQVKLGFAIATAVDADILIVDEVLAVGDLAFQRKCYDRIESFVRAGDRTLLLVSHNLRQIERLCSRVLLMNHGQLQADGSPKSVCEAFLQQSNAKIVSDRRTANGKYESSGEIGAVVVEVRDALMTMPASTVVSGNDIVVEVGFDALVPLSGVTFTVGIHTTDLFFIAVSSSDTTLALAEIGHGKNSLTCRFTGLALTPGAYAITFGVESGHTSAPIFRTDNVVTFQVVSDVSYNTPASESFGVLRTETSWRLSAGEGDANHKKTSEDRLAANEAVGDI